MSSLPVKVVLTKQLSFSGKTLVRECAFAVMAVYTFDVPQSIQNLEQEFVRNGQLASCALLNHTANLRLHPDNCGSSLAYSFLRPLWMYVRLCKVQGSTREIYASNSSTCTVGGTFDLAAAKRDSKANLKGGFADFLNTAALFYSGDQICI